MRIIQSLSIFILLCIIYFVISYSNAFAQLTTDYDNAYLAASISSLLNDNDNEKTLQKVTLKKLLEIGLQNNISIKNAIISNKAANTQVLQARANNSTKISGKFIQTRLDGVGTANIAGKSIKLGKEEVQKAYIELSQPLYLGDKDHYSILIARKTREISLKNIEQVKQNLIYQISIAYYNWLYKREVVKVAQKDAELAQAHYNVVRAKYENAQLSKFELLRAEVRVAQTKAKLIQEQNAENNAKLDLIRILFLPENSNFSSSETLQFCEFKPNLSQDLEQLENTRPELQIKKIEFEISKYNIKIAKGDKHPTVSMFGQAGSEDPSSKSGLGGPVKKGFWNVGLSIELPILDGGLRKAKINETKAKYEISKNAYQDFLHKIRIEVKQAYANLLAASEMVLSQKKTMELAEEALRLAHIRYSNGMLTQVELFDAENAYLYAHLQYVASVFAHHKETLNYLLATGKLNEDLACFYNTNSLHNKNNCN